MISATAEKKKKDRQRVEVEDVVMDGSTAVEPQGRPSPGDMQNFG